MVLSIECTDRWSLSNPTLPSQGVGILGSGVGELPHNCLWGIGISAFSKMVWSCSNYSLPLPSALLHRCTELTLDSGRYRWSKEWAEASSGAEWLPREEESITTLAHVARGITEMKWSEHLAWVKEGCRGKRYHLLRERQRADPVASRVRKTLASRFYQFRTGKARTGPYLAMVGQAGDDKCWWCSNGGSGLSQTQAHLFKHCHRWRDQQITMWRAIGKATGGKRASRNTSMAQLFGDERCTAAILEFLATTKVGLSGRRFREEEPGGEESGESEEERRAESG
jgi:hypothetical protein